MNKGNKSFPRLRQSVALISAAIFLSTTVHAKINIERLPALNSSGERVIGAKPNLFLTIDNSKAMGSSSSGLNPNEITPNFNLLQQTAAALISALPQLEDKVRVGYTTGYRGVLPHGDVLTDGCGPYKLNGNVSKLFSKGYLSEEVKKDLEANKNYVVGDYDFVFKNDSGAQTGSGYGEIVPRDFSGNYARYIYAWLGAMCPSSGATDINDASEATLTTSVTKAPPYAELDPNAADKYRTAARDAHNISSYPTTNIGSNFGTNESRPIIQMHNKFLSLISDINFIGQIANCGSSRCQSQGGGSLAILDTKNFKIDPKRYVMPSSDRIFDAYAPVDPTDGFPGTDPISCRRNYEIIISAGPYSRPKNVNGNTDVGVSGYTKNPYFTWVLSDSMPSDNNRNFPKDEFYTRMYRYLPASGTAATNLNLDELPTSTTAPGRGYLFGKSALQSYYSDLRSDLNNDILPFYVVKDRPQGLNGAAIPKDWDRKNDTAPWQHLTIFNLGFDKFKSWKKATIYNQNYTDLDPEGGPLEGYFRAIEDGSIYKDNEPLADWGRGDSGINKKNYYIFRGVDNKEQRITLPYLSGQDDPLAEMDFAKAGVISRGGSFMITDYDSIKKVISTIASRIESASETIQGISGGAVSGGGRVTAIQQAVGGNDSTLFATYLDQATHSGNIFAFKNCPLLQKDDKRWSEQRCGKRLWNAATVLYNDARRGEIGNKTIIPTLDNNKNLVGNTFVWDRLDNDLKKKFNGNDTEDKFGEARVNWLNGILTADTKVKKSLREYPNVAIPIENNGALKDGDNVVSAEETDIPNLMGEIVYATPKAVDNRGTLPSAHPLYNEKYNEFIKETVLKRKPLVLAGANDGRLYAFNNSNEKLKQYATFAFSYIPRHVMTRKEDSLIDYISPKINPNRRGFVNGPFSVRDAFVNNKWGTYLVGTLGTGGGVVYALDISKGTANDPTEVFKWETEDKYGTIMTEPRIVWLRSKKDVDGKPTGKWVVIVPTGYNAEDVSLVILDLATGEELAKINTNSKYSNASEEGDIRTCKIVKNQNGLEDTLSVPKDVTCDNGLGALTVVDADLDGGADYVYAGDLLGHIWKFDLTGFFKDPSELKVAYEGHPVFIAETADSVTRQPITAMIEIADGAYGEGSMLYFGTGRLFSQKERELLQQQSFYGIWDNPRYVTQKNYLPLRRNVNAKNAIYGFIKYDTFNLDNKSGIKSPNSSLHDFSEIRGVRRKDNLSSSKYLALDLGGESVSPDDKAIGWIIDFPNGIPKERVIGRGYSFEGSVFFPTFEPKGGTASIEESCTPVKNTVGGEARFYMVDRLTGGQLDKSPFDFTGDGNQDEKDQIEFKGRDVDPTDKRRRDTYSDTKESNKGTLPLSPAALNIGKGTGNFLSITGVLSMLDKSKKDNQCDYTRQIIFPGTSKLKALKPDLKDQEEGDPLVLTSCHRNRYKTWKQPVIE